MRNAMLAAMLVMATESLGARQARVSPHEIHEFTIDGSNISINYGRPSKRGREIWGSLVPYTRWWMPGADEATIITTEHPLVLGGTLTVPAGRHTIYSQPDPDVMKLIINTQVGQFHTFYSPAMDLGRVDLTLKKLAEPVEQLTFQIDPLPQGGGVLKLIWDDREYSVGIAAKK